jgi:dienelactone hydrolase
MKPYDNALPQEREWEEQADIYGYIICAPELHTSDSFMEFPLTKEHGYVLADKRNVLAIMDHIFATTEADPEKVLLTSWSCGGYLVHYLANRYPDRFACIATRLSNFSAKLMMEDNVPLYRDRVPVAIFIGDGDFAACKSESQDAVAWYTARGFRIVDGKMIDRMGHWRIPQTAAAFFADQMGIEPLHPDGAAKTVAAVIMTDYSPPEQLVAKFSPDSRTASAASQGQTQFAQTLSSD